MSLDLPGTINWKVPLITPDGENIWLSEKGRFSGGSAGFGSWEMPTLYELTSLFDIGTGQLVRKLNPIDPIPPNLSWNGIDYYKSPSSLPGSHGGNFVGYDGNIYTVRLAGCCGPCGSGEGTLYVIDTITGKVTKPMNNLPEPEDGSFRIYDPAYCKTLGDGTYTTIADGPADAKSLRFTSTLYAIQSPRNGAILFGGWDQSGIREYHDGFVTSVISGMNPSRSDPAIWTWFKMWNGIKIPGFEARNSNPSIAPDGSLYIADVNDKDSTGYTGHARIIRIYRTDWPTEQPVNGYAEQFMPKAKVETLRLEYAQNYIASYSLVGQPPVAKISANKISGLAPLTVNFTGTGTDIDGTITSYSWNFGDNSSSSLQNPSHTYNNSGVYLVTLTVTDDSGNKDSDFINITVTSTPTYDTTPPSTITNLSNSNITQNSVNLSWTAPGDDGNIGTASSYDIRYSTSIINESNWEALLKFLANLCLLRQEPLSQWLLMVYHPILHIILPSKHPMKCRTGQDYPMSFQPKPNP